VTFKNSIDRYYFLFLFTAFTALILGLGSYGLAETSEARYAEISREMFVYGDYLNPELLGVYHFHKPPIAYYITALGYQLFGINEFGARFFLQVAIIIQLLLVYRLADLLFKDKWVAFMAGLIYFSLPIVLISSRNLTTDAFLTTFIIAAIYCWQVYSDKTKILFLYPFYALVGIALLTKGPVALLFIGVYIAVSKIILKKGLRISVHHIIGVMLCIGIGASWYVMVMLENPKLWDYFIQKQLISRMNSNSFNRSKPFWFYIPLIFAMLLPWLLALLPRFKFHLKSIHNKEAVTKILLYSSFLLFVLFSVFSTKLIMYILPVFWMPAIIIAVEIKKATQKSRNIISLVHAVLLGLLFIGMIICWFAQPEFIQVTIVSLLVTFGCIIAFSLLFIVVENERYFKPVILAGVFGVSLLLISDSVMAHNSALTNSTKDMVRFIDNFSNEKDKTILVYDYLLTSIPFYTNDHFITIKSTHNTTNREVQFENDDSWKEGLWDIKNDSTAMRLSSLSRKHNTYLLVPKKRDLETELAFIKENFDGEKEYPKWTLYYHK
jgi:4-amino-4-deoxy-L-arabinose transferase